MTVIDMAEARRAKRRPVLDMALIRIGDMSFSWIVHNLTDAGAALADLEAGPGAANLTAALRLAAGLRAGNDDRIALLRAPEEAAPKVGGGGDSYEDLEVGEPVENVALSGASAHCDRSAARSPWSLSFEPVSWVPLQRASAVGVTAVVEAVLARVQPVARTSSTSRVAMVVRVTASSLGADPSVRRSARSSLRGGFVRRR